MISKRLHPGTFARTITLYIRGRSCEQYLSFTNFLCSLVTRSEQKYLPLRPLSPSLLVDACCVHKVSGSEYLDKIIHVPFCVPFGTRDQRRSLTNSWLGVTEAHGELCGSSEGCLFLATYLVLTKIQESFSLEFDEE